MKDHSRCLLWEWLDLHLYIVVTCIERNDGEREAQAMLRVWLKDMPTPRKRFTYIHKNRVEINEEDLGELLIYMAELEDYLQEVGKTISEVLE